MSEVQTTAWSETTGAGANNTAAPDGWPEGMAPSGVNDSGRGIMSAVKRWVNRLCGLDNAGALLSTAGTSTAYTLTFSNAPASLYTGAPWGCKIHTDCGDNPTLNVNGLGAVNLQKATTSGLTNVVTGDLKQNQSIMVKYDGTLAKFLLLTPVASVLSDPMTTRGDLVVRNSSNVTARLAVGAANTVLRSDGTDPAYGKVTLSDEATGTAGNVRVWDASGNPAAAATGTSGHVLTSNGAGAAPTFQSASISGMVVLAETIASASATIDFVLTSHLTNYEDFDFIISHLRPATNGVDLVVRTSTDGGSTYDSAAANYNYMTQGRNDAGTATSEGASATGVQLNTNTTISNVATDGFSGTVRCYQPVAVNPCKFTWNGTYGNGTNWQSVEGAGNRQASADVDAVRFLFSSGNITSGKITLVGRRKFS